MAILDSEWIIGVIEELSKRRPVFYSEADFQFELAWELNSKFKENRVDYKIRLEYPVTIDGEQSYIDIIVDKGDELIPIELKYKTKEAEYVGNPEFHLKEQSAQDISRYLFWKDVHRIESLVTSNEGRWGKGFAIFLSNDDRFWRLNGAGTIYEMFSMVDGDYLPQEEMKWKKESVPDGHWTKKYKALKREGYYRIHWKNYWEFYEREKRLDEIKRSKTDKTGMQYVILQCSA